MGTNAIGGLRVQSTCTETGAGHGCASNKWKYLHKRLGAAGRGEA